MIPQSSSKSRPLSPTTPKRISCSFFDKEFLPQFSRCVRDAHDIYIHRLYLKRNRRNVPWYWIARMHFRWATSYLLPFAYSLFVERNSWITLECCPNLWTSFSVIFCAIKRSHERPLRASAASCLWVLLLSTAASPFSILLSPYRQIDLPSSQCPCSVIWFEEFLMGSYKVVLCPRSGEGYFGLARRTYSLQCLPDISAVRLNRFTFRFCG